MDQDSVPVSNLWANLWPQLSDIFNQARDFVAENGWLIMGLAILTYYAYTSFLRDWLHRRSVNSGAKRSTQQDQELEEMHREQRRLAVLKQQELLAAANEEHRKKLEEKRKKRREEEEEKFKDVFGVGYRSGTADDPNSSHPTTVSRARPPTSGGFNPLSGTSGGGGYRPSGPRRRGGGG